MGNQPDFEVNIDELALYIGSPNYDGERLWVVQRPNRNDIIRRCLDLKKLIPKENLETFVTIFSFVVLFWAVKGSTRSSVFMWLLVGVFAVYLVRAAHFYLHVEKQFDFTTGQPDDVEALGYLIAEHSLILCTHGGAKLFPDDNPQGTQASESLYITIIQREEWLLLK
ncbi:unnamed protein product [Clonostachys byssicola]|uniref:Uncharacterized protein n=1 Tax=Clonostachys byssicola TaxID=160290 RepID=A0A9N9U2P8_9HYPO|nr:unnamed protein product [Clonostachys byssicola]